MKLSDLPQDTPEQKMAVRNCILFQKCGAEAYGTYIPGKSDSDFMGCFLEDEGYNGLGLKNIEHVEFRTNPTSSGKKNTKDDVDCTLFSLSKYITLLLSGNPNSLEGLFYPANCKIFVNSFGQKLIDNRDIFVSKKSFHTFKGYGFNQLKRMDRGETKTTGRAEIVEKFGYDCKMGSHAIRLYLECIELLSTGHITLPLKENNLVLAIKRGEYSKEKFMEEAHRLEAVCDNVYANSTLKFAPDHEKAHKLLMEMHKKYYGYGKASTGKLSKIFSNFFRDLADYLDK